MMVPLHLSGGVLVTRDGRRRVDLLAIDGRIAAIGSELELPPDTVRLDVQGLCVLPGVIDPHTHFWEDGFAAAPDFRDGSLSAVCGGITTVIDMPLTEPCVLDLPTLRDKIALGVRTSRVDFALFGGASPTNGDMLEPLWRAGVVGLKIFTCATGCAMQGVTRDADLHDTLARIARFGGLASLHAEDEERLAANHAGQLRAGRNDEAAFLAWHDEAAELLAMRRILGHAKTLGARVNIVHVTSPTGLALVAAARDDGVAATAETCPHYLYLGAEDVLAQGSRAACAPPVRERRGIAAMRARVADGSVHTIGTDHCAVSLDRKRPPAIDAQPGLPGLETMVPLLLNLVARGELTLERMVEVTSHDTARLYGLYPRKGSVEIGADADFTIVDPDAVWTIGADRLAGSAGWTPYEGITVQGRVEMTVIRGRLVARGGRAVDADGPAAFIPRQQPAATATPHPEGHAT